MASEGSAGGVLSSLGFALLGTTCCAMPITLVALGAGSAVAALASSAPWLVVLSKYKGWTFSATAIVQAYAWWRLRTVGECDIAAAHRLRWQHRVLWASTGIFAVSLFAAYGLLPLERLAASDRQRWQMHALPFAASGTRSSRVLGKFSRAHQQPEASAAPAAITQALSSPQSGHVLELSGALVTSYVADYFTISMPSGALA